MQELFIVIFSDDAQTPVISIANKDNLETLLAETLGTMSGYTKEQVKNAAHSLCVNPFGPLANPNTVCSYSTVEMYIHSVLTERANIAEYHERLTTRPLFTLKD